MTDSATQTLNIQVCYALAEHQELIDITLPANATAGQAIEASGLLQKYPEIDLAQNKIGIYGKLVKLDATLHERDRIEIYRPLIADPKEVRRKRAEEGKVMKKGGGDV